MCASILDGKEWTGDNEEVVWTVQIAEQVKNRLKGAFGCFFLLLLFIAARFFSPRAHCSG